MSEKKYFENWGSYEDMKSGLVGTYWDYSDEVGQEVQKATPADFPTEDEVLFASYGYADYTGNCLVVFERDGQLYRMDDGHCSCDGISWNSASPTTWDELATEEMLPYVHGGEARQAFKDLVEANR